MTKYFIVDTNIIIQYINNSNISLINFINNSGYKFFYTETVRKEVLNPKYKTEMIPSIFIYYETKLHPDICTCAYKELSGCGLLLNITENKLCEFKNDIRIIMEAGYVCYKVSPDDYLIDSKFLTCNQVIFKKLVSNKNNREILEDIINRHGLDHLITIEHPEMYYTEEDDVTNR